MWFGGSSGVALRRAARVGDGFTFASAGRKTVDQVEQLRSLLAAEGRDPSTFPIEFTLMYDLGEARWASAAEGARAAGIDYVSVNAMSTTAGWTGIDAPPGCGPRPSTSPLGALHRGGHLELRARPDETGRPPSVSAGPGPSPGLGRPLGGEDHRSMPGDEGHAYGGPGFDVLEVGADRADAGAAGQLDGVAPGRAAELGPAHHGGAVGVGREGDVVGTDHDHVAGR